MKEAIETLCAFAASNLPDSISERKKVLRAIEKLLVHSHPVHRDVMAQLAAIAAMEKFDAQLKIHFSPAHNGGGK